MIVVEGGEKELRQVSGVGGFMRMGGGCDAVGSFDARRD